MVSSGIKRSKWEPDGFQSTLCQDQQFVKLYLTSLRPQISTSSFFPNGRVKVNILSMCVTWGRYLILLNLAILLESGE